MNRADDAELKRMTEQDRIKHGNAEQKYNLLVNEIGYKKTWIKKTYKCGSDTGSLSSLFDDIPTYTESENEISESSGSHDIGSMADILFTSVPYTWCGGKTTERTIKDSPGQPTSRPKMSLEKMTEEIKMGEGEFLYGISIADM